MLPTAFMKKLLVIIVIIAAAGAAAWFYLSPQPNRVTLANYKRINVGMTRVQVAGILGRPYADDASPLTKLLRRNARLHEHTAAKEVNDQIAAIAANLAPNETDGSTSRRIRGTTRAGQVDCEIMDHRLVAFDGQINYRENLTNAFAATPHSWLMRNGKLDFHRARQTSQATIDGSFALWEGKGDRAILVGFNPDASFYSYQAPKDDFPIDMKELRQAVIGQYDADYPRWSVGEQVSLVNHGKKISGEIAIFLPTAMVLQCDTARVQISFKEMDELTRVRVDPDFRAARIDAAVSERAVR